MFWINLQQIFQCFLLFHIQCYYIWTFFLYSILGGCFGFEIENCTKYKCTLHTVRHSHWSIILKYHSQFESKHKNEHISFDPWSIVQRTPFQVRLQIKQTLFGSVRSWIEWKRKKKKGKNKWLGSKKSLKCAIHHSGTR